MASTRSSGSQGLGFWSLLLGPSKPRNTVPTSSLAVSQASSRTSGSTASASSVPVTSRASGAPSVSSAVTRDTKSSVVTKDSKSPVTVVSGTAVPGPVSALKPGKPLTSPSEGVPGQGPNATLLTTLKTRNDISHGDTVSAPSTLKSASNKTDLNFIRDTIMGVAVFGTIFFLFFYNMSSGLKSNFPKTKRKKKICEHNYYEEYEREFEKHDSEDESLDSQSDRYYLNYQPERDYYK